MGYLPSASARMMRGGQSSLVGLIIPDIQNDFYATVAKIVADSLALHSMQLLLSVTDDDPERELRELRAMLETRPAGIIIVPTASPRPETSALLQNRSEEHTSELQSLMRISYAVFCLQKQNNKQQ